MLWRGRKKSNQIFIKAINAGFGDCGAKTIDEQWTACAGVNIRQDPATKLFHWTCAKAIKEALAKHAASNLKPKKTPAPGALAVTKHETAPEGERDQHLVKRYLSRMGSLNYVVTVGRVDTAVICNQLSAVMAGPSPQHFEMQTNVLAYLKHTAGMYLQWDPAMSPVRLNQLYYYTDGSFAGEHLQSRLGVVAMLNGGMVNDRIKTGKIHVLRRL